MMILYDYFWLICFARENIAYFHTLLIIYVILYMLKNNQSMYVQDSQNYLYSKKNIGGKQMSTRNKSKSKKSNVIPKQKENDTLFLLQNQNQILKLKNQQLHSKIQSMQNQLKSLTENIHRSEIQCDDVRNRIKATQYSDDIRLEQQCKALNDKIAFVKGNEDIMTRKIAEVRESTLYEQSKIPEISQEKKAIEREIWEQKTKNQGLKIVLADMEQQLQKARANNQILVSQRKTKYGPKQKNISDEIQERIRIMKNTKGRTDAVRKNQGAQLIYMLFSHLQKDKGKQVMILMEGAALRRKIVKKKIFLLSLIRRKYVGYIKNRALQKFRKSFRPLTQQKQFQKILQHTISRRIKNRLFRTWRSQAIKQQYTRTRYFEVQNTFETLYKSFSLSNLYSSFNIIKYFQKNPVKNGAGQTISDILDYTYKRSLNSFFSSLCALKNKQILNEEVEESAKQHSILLVLSMYFSAWIKLTKQNKTSNRILKFKYFRELKKLRAIKKKRQLSQMLIIAHEKIKQIDLISSSFCHMKKQTVKSMLEQLKQDLKTINSKNINLQEKIDEINKSTKQLYNNLGLLKISSHLKNRMEKAFNIWRLQNRKVMKFKLILNMLASKIYNDMNFGFAKIQRRRFQKLKLSIADKIKSCEFSYNYLLKENKHIKDVLDTKLLDLEKSKFVNILHRLVRNQKEIKHKYFFKFMKSGYKCWKFKKTFQRADQIIETRVKVAAFFMFKYIAKEKRRAEYVARQCQSKLYTFQKKLMSLCFGVFENIRNRNKHIKKTLENIFERNGQLNVYVGYGEVKRIYSKFKEDKINSVNQGVLEKIKSVDDKSKNQQGLIEMYRDRLTSKQKSIYLRIVLSARKFFVTNSKNRAMHYVNRWRNKVKYQGKIRKFAQILERRTRIYIKSKFAMNFFRGQKQQQCNQLRERLKNFKDQLNEQIKNFQNFSTDSTRKMQQMKIDNETHNQVGKQLQKKTQRMDTIKVQGFRRYWGKIMCSFVMRDWRQHKLQFVESWKRGYQAIRIAALRHNFQVLSEEMKQQILVNKLKKNLSRIYNKKFTYNAGLAFRIWRIVSLNKKIEIFKKEYDSEVALYQMITKKYELMTNQYNDQVNYRIGDRKRRKIFDFLKKYTRLKLSNQKNQRKLEHWLNNGYQSQFFKLFTKKTQGQVKQKRKATKHRQNKPLKQIYKLFYSLQKIVKQKKTIKKLFINKYIHHALLLLNEQFFTKMKNYYRYVQVEKKNYRTFQIQKIIEVFEKKRKNILCHNIRRWRRNQFQINMGKNLFKRLTRKAFYNRYEGMFYAWKLEAEAKKVLAYHQEEGQVKKRKVEIQRIEKFLQDLKKQKGLLLQNQDGNFVMSPRFQKKKEEEDRKDKNFRYKFISRLIMSINGYGPPIRAYNNMQMYQKLRRRYKQKARFVLNHLRKPDLLLAFKTWRKAAGQFRQSFETMQRKELIKILNKQKDKMEMQYSHKLQIDDKVRTQLERYRVFSHQREKKQKLCGFVLKKHANKVKSHAFRTWRERANQLKQQQMYDLGNKGENRMQNLEEELNQLEEIQRQFLETNRFLKTAVSQALSIAQMVKRITDERDKLSNLITQKNITCQSLLEENQSLNSKLYLAQKEAMNLLIISGEKP